MREISEAINVDLSYIEAQGRQDAMSLASQVTRIQLDEKCNDILFGSRITSKWLRR